MNQNSHKKMTLPPLRDVARNSVITCQVIGRHLNDDPLLLGINIARLAPAQLSERIGKLLTQLPGAGTHALGAYLLGKDFPAEAQELLTTHVTSRWQKTQQRIAAETAIHYGLIHWKDPKIPAKTRARSAWDNGAIDEAIDLAHTAGAHSYVHRLESEKNLLDPNYQLPLNGSTQHVPQRTIPSANGQKINALHLITNSLPATQSGYTLRTQRLLNALIHAGVTIHALTRTGYPVMVGTWNATPTVHVEEVTYQRTLPLKLAKTHAQRLTQWANYARQIVQQEKINLIHTTTNYPNAIVAKALSQELNIPWVYEVRGMMEQTWVSQKKTPQQQKDAEQSQRFTSIQARETQLMHEAHHIVTLSNVMKNLIVERGIPAEKITVIPNAVREELFEQNLSSTQARNLLGLPSEGFWVGSVSSLVDYEGFDVLLRAVAIARSQGEDIRVLLAGSGAAQPSLRSLVQELNLQEHTTFLGKITPDKAMIAHQGLDLFVVPRKNTRVCRSVTPLKPIEAMALKRPVLCSDIPPLAELINNTVTAQTGKLFLVENCQSLAEAIIDLKNNPPLRAELARQGREFARTRTWKSNAERMTEVYHKIVGGSQHE
ncbi:glycosyltransferase family 4 protein [Rothia sp. P7208]|uniref:glycosyltransferase family 4 protein n=1 Tax=Rothia sp. P7208 TaxID=3402660 RepID=UPI003AC6850D